MKLPRVFQGTLLGIVIPLVIVGALAWAQAGSLPDKQCMVGLLLWIGCAMAAHENLAGGLIGAGGALLRVGWPGALFANRSTMSADARLS